MSIRIPSVLVDAAKLRLGQCGAVTSFGERVREIDPGCYAVEFVAIQCRTQ